MVAVIINMILNLNYREDISIMLVDVNNMLRNPKEKQKKLIKILKVLSRSF
jgi:hypothetical protein